MAKHRLSCNKCGHTWQVSSKELAGGLVSCPGCQVVGTAAPKSDYSSKYEEYLKIRERDSSQDGLEQVGEMFENGWNVFMKAFQPLLILGVIAIIGLSIYNREPTASSGQGSIVHSVASSFTSAKQWVEQATAKEVSTPYIEANKGRVYYEGPATKGEATALGNYFVPEIFDGSEKLVELSYADGFYCLLFPISPSIRRLPGLEDQLAVLAFTLSADVFGDKPVKINLCDQEFDVFATVTSTDGAEVVLTATAPNSIQSSSPNSVAYDRGYDWGKRMG